MRTYTLFTFDKYPHLGCYKHVSTVTPLSLFQPLYLVTFQKFLTNPFIPYIGIDSHSVVYMKRNLVSSTKVKCVYNFIYFYFPALLNSRIVFITVR